MHGHRQCRAGVTALAVIVAAGTALAAPPYIQAERAASEKKFGAAMTDRIFSDEFTEARSAWIKSLTANIPDLACPADPGVALVAIEPHASADGTYAWVERYVVNCGGTEVPRTLFIQSKPDGIALASLTPGPTWADPVLQLDAQTQVYMAAALKAGTDCDRFVLTDSKVVTPPENGGPWTELWSVAACGTLVDIDVSFTPSPSGGTAITASLSETGE